MIALMKHLLGYVISRKTFVEDPQFLSELVCVVNRLVTEREEVAEILRGESPTRAIQCIKECRSHVAAPTPQNRRRMRAAWAKLDKQEQFDLTKVAYYQISDNLTVKTLLRLAGVSVSEAQRREAVHRATDEATQVPTNVQGRKIMSL